MLGASSSFWWNE